jgi:sulfite dehydrogenase
MNEPEGSVRDKENQGTSRFGTWLIGIGLGAAVLLAMLIAYEIGTQQSDETVVEVTRQAGEIPPPPQPPSGDGAAVDTQGQELFVASCGSCHTLSEAGTDGALGPNLDDLQPDAALVLSAIENGGAGSGAMPAGLLQGSDAQAVSDYVASAAGSGG